MVDGWWRGLGVYLSGCVLTLTPLGRIEKPRILLLDCNLEYKKGESKTDAELMKQEDFTKMLQLEVGEGTGMAYQRSSLWQCLTGGFHQAHGG